MRFTLCLALTTAIALPVRAALPPCVYDALVAAAPDVVQLHRLTLREDGPDDMCQMEGTVVRAFRGQFEIGQHLRFSVPCDIDRPPEVGPTVYHATDALDAAEVVEVHFNAEGEIAGHGEGLIVLDAPSDAVAWRPFCE
jgi:hypothetical protein